MERFVIEERVPCSLPELHQERVRLPFECSEATVYLGTQIKVVPMLEGYRLSSMQGAYFVDHLNTIDVLCDQGLIPADCVDEQRIELEQINAAGLLTSQVSSRQRYTLFDHGEAYRSLYDPDQTSWFSMSPVTLELDLTNRCNLRCVHCCRDSSPSADVTEEMTSLELFNLLDQAADIGVDEVSFLGGEPTLHPHLFHLAYLARKRGIDNLMLATNALEIREEWLDPFSVLFTNIQISLHGASAATHEAIVDRKGAFEQVVTNVRRLTSHGANISLACTVLESRPNELQAILDLARDLAVTEIRLIPLADVGRGHCLPPLQWGDYKQVGEFIANARKDDTGLWVGSGGFPTGESTTETALYYGCAAGLTKLHLNAHGIATGCSLLESHGLDGRNTPLLEIWHSDQMRHMRKRVNCDCVYVSRCAGGCLSVPNNRANGKENNNGKQG
ncbi:MAG: radical SAM protein [Candidatus Aegiribacteria sp.]|nr:radical SAM protein [Candidatus Aegiribacteria sp.]